MLANRLIQLIENHSESLAQEALHDILTNLQISAGNLFDELRVVLNETQQAVLPKNASGQFFRHSGDQTVLGYRCDRTVFTSSLVPVSAIFVDIARG